MLNKIRAFGLWFISTCSSFSRALTSLAHLPFSKLVSLNKFSLEYSLFEPREYIGDVDTGEQGYINSDGGIQKI